MELLCKYIIAILVFCAVQVPIAPLPSQQDDYDNVMYEALRNLSQYNISKIKEKVNEFLWLANDFDLSEKYTIGEGMNHLTNAGTSVYNLVSIGKRVCGPSYKKYPALYQDELRSNTDIDQILANFNTKINNAKSKLLPVAPTFKEVSKSLSLLALNANNTLKYQLNLLSENILNVTCPKSLADNDKQSFYKCISDQINKFGKYYNEEIEQLESYRQDALIKSYERRQLLDQWLTLVAQDRWKIYLETLNVAEYYLSTCNIGFNDIALYAVSRIIWNHKKTFDNSITTNVTAVNNLVTAILSRDYAPYKPDIRTRLEAAVTPLRTAIAAVLGSTGASAITEEIKRVPDNLIKDGIEAMNLFAANFSVRALKAGNETGKVINERQRYYKTYSSKYLKSYCLAKSNDYRYLMNDCCNYVASTVYYTDKDYFLQKLLLDTKNELVNINTNYAQLLANKGDYLVKEANNSAYSLAYKLYQDAGLSVPQDVLMYQCYQGIILPNNKFICIAVA